MTCLRLLAESTGWTAGPFLSDPRGLGLPPLVFPLPRYLRERQEAANALCALREAMVDEARQYEAAMLGWDPVLGK